MRVVRVRGRLQLRLEPAEVELLTSLLDEMDGLLDGPADPDDPVLQRLNPAAYPGDPAADAEYRTLTDDSLRAARGDRMAACRAELAASATVDLAEPDVAERWIQVLNDLRLALGTRLGVTEEDDRDIDPTDPDAQPWLVYYWLTGAQDAVVHGLMR